MQADVIITLWDTGDGKWFLTMLLEGKEATVWVGAGNAKVLTEELKIPYANPLDKNAVSIKDADVKAKASLYDRKDNSWLLELSLENGNKANAIFTNDPLRVSKLMTLGIPQRKG